MCRHTKHILVQRLDLQWNRQCNHFKVRSVSTEHAMATKSQSTFPRKKRDFIKANMATPDILDIATNFKFVPLKQHRHAVEWHHNILFPLFGELLCDSSNRRIRLFLYKMIESHLAPYTSSQTQCGRIPQCRSYRHCTAPSLPPNGYPK